MPGILVYALHDDEGNFNKNSLGALSEAAKLAGELGTEAAAVVVGDVADDAAAGLGAYGVKKVYRAKEAPEGLAQPIVDVMAKVMQDNDFSYALFGGGLLGFEIGAGLTARLNAGVTMEVTQVNVQDGKLVAERPILQDSQIADVGYVEEPGIIIGRLNAFDENETGGTAEVEDVQVELSDWSTKAKMVKRGEQRGADVNIEDANVLVGGGRGLGKKENFELAEQLADSMGGAVAATRAVVDAGWYPYAAQIGQTGKTVAPNLYLALGISGAIQHKVGMQNSENILAINKDQNAPIFEFSDLGVVGDLHKIVPKLTEAIKAKKGETLPSTHGDACGLASRRPACPCPSKGCALRPPICPHTPGRHWHRAVEFPPPSSRRRSSSPITDPRRSGSRSASRSSAEAPRASPARSS